MTDTVDELQRAHATYCENHLRHDFESMTDEDRRGVQFVLGQTLVSEVLRHLPALLARLRAAEAAVPKWRKATEEDRAAALNGTQFLETSRWKLGDRSTRGWSRTSRTYPRPAPGS